MATAERIDKYHEDILSLLETKKDSLGSEISKLSKWLLKHQDEALPDAQKNKLFTIVQKCYKHASETPDIHPVLRGKIQSLIEDLCKMPVGKLVSMKTKKQGAKWLDFFTEERSCETKSKVKRYQVVDVEDSLVLFMDPVTFDNVDYNETESTIRDTLNTRLSGGEDVFVHATLDKDDNIISYRILED